MSSPTPISPTGKLVAASTFDDEIRVPPRLTVVSNVVLKIPLSGAFSQVALLAASNSRLRPTVVTRLLLMNQRVKKFVRKVLLGERTVMKPFVPLVAPE